MCRSAAGGCGVRSRPDLAICALSSRLPRAQCPLLVGCHTSDLRRDAFFDIDITDGDQRDELVDARGRADITLIVTGGLRTHADFAKAMALGADAVAVANSAMQAIGCLGMRACATTTVQ